ncbi:MAG: FtsX-like permease family protein [Holdemanella porci]
MIIEIFAFIFLFYTHSFLIKRRQKEFALFSILGMEKKHLARVLFYETLITLLVSLILGIGLGVLLDKAMFLVIAKMIGADIILGFYFSFIGMRQCVLVIGLIYVLIYFYSMIRIHISSPIELLIPIIWVKKSLRPNGFFPLLVFFV